MKFADIPGHESVKTALRNAVDAGRMPHAVMLSGPAGAGKMMLARALAQYLQCTDRHDGEPCGRCQNCRLNEELNHPDLHFIFPMVKNQQKKREMCADVIEEWREMLRRYPAMPEEQWLQLLNAGNSQPTIYVRDADEIVRADAYPAYTSDRKIFMIWLPERMQLPAANKLLKVIEEPSPGTQFILVSNNDLQLLPTIFSRVQRFHVGRLEPEEIQQYIARKYGLTPPDAIRLAHISEGSLIKADEFGAEEGENQKFLALYQEIMRAAYAKKVLRLKQLGDQAAAFGREKIRRFLDYMARMVRENFIYNLRMPALSAMTDEEARFSERFSPFINHGNVEDFMVETDRAKRDIERNANSKLVLFDYFLTMIILLHRKVKK